MTRRLAPAAIAATAVLGALLLPMAATAGGGDRNKDRIPDRWERSHHLSLKVKQTAKDQDRDGLRNLAEWRNHTNPRDADSDNDGLDDGDEVRVGSKPRDRDSDDDGTRDDDENAGTVQSFSAGTLTIALAGGGTLTADVVDGVTEIECEDDHSTAPATTSAPAPAPAARTTRSSRDHGDDDHGDDDEGDDDEGDDSHGGDAGACSASDLTTGAVVHEAEIKTMGGKAVFTEVEIVRAAA